MSIDYKKYKEFKNKDFKGRDMILPVNWYYQVKIDDVEIEKSWADLDNIFNTREDLLKDVLSNNSRSELKEIFKSLMSLMINNKKGLDFSSKDSDAEIEKAINRGKNRGAKYSINKINYIFATNDSFGLFKDGEMIWDMPKYLLLIEQMLHGQIVIVDREIINSEWFSNLDLSESEVRIYQQGQSFEDMLYRKTIDDTREIYVLGGEEVFKAGYYKVTDFWIAFVDKFSTDFDSFMSELPLYSLEVSECNTIDDETPFKMTHLYLPTTKTQPKWKVNRYKLTDEEIKKFKIKL